MGRAACVRFAFPRRFACPSGLIFDPLQNGIDGVYLAVQDPPGRPLRQLQPHALRHLGKRRRIARRGKALDNGQLARILAE